MLKLNNNNLSRLPFAIRRLKSLRTLGLSGNRIESLPNVMARMTLDTIDLAGEHMFPKEPQLPAERMIPPNLDEVFQKPPQLWQIASKIVISKRYKWHSHIRMECIFEFV